MPEKILEPPLSVQVSETPTPCQVSTRMAPLNQVFDIVRSLSMRIPE